MDCFRCNKTENFIFSPKYCQRKVGLIRQKKFLVYVQLSYTKISCLHKNTHLQKDAAFLHFHLKESSENVIFPWNGKIRKLTKIWSFLSFSQIFVRRKFFFSCSEWFVFSKFAVYFQKTLFKRIPMAEYFYTIFYHSTILLLPSVKTVHVSIKNNNFFSYCS